MNRKSDESCLIVLFTNSDQPKLLDNQATNLLKSIITTFVRLILMLMWTIFNEKIILKSMTCRWLIQNALI